MLRKIWWGILGLTLATPSVWALPSVKRNIVYSQPQEGVELLLDAYIPSGEGPFPAVLVVHGGSWKSGSKAQLAGTRGFDVSAGTFTVNLVCLSDASSTVVDPALTAIFIPDA